MLRKTATKSKVTAVALVVGLMAFSVVAMFQLAGTAEATHSTKARKAIFCADRSDGNITINGVVYKKCTPPALTTSEANTYQGLAIQGTTGKDWILAPSSIYHTQVHDYIAGDADNDIIQGGEGEDVLSGGGGNDILYAWNTSHTSPTAGSDSDGWVDSINCGSGTDTAYPNLGDSAASNCYP